MEASRRIGYGKVFIFGMVGQWGCWFSGSSAVGGGRKRLELAEARFEVGGENGRVSEGRTVDGGNLVEKACVVCL